MVKRNVLLLIGLGVLAACAAPAAPPEVATAPGVASPAPTEGQALTELPAPTAPAAEVPARASATADTFVISEDFVPSDPATVSLAAGRPQLIEFFAFW